MRIKQHTFKQLILGLTEKEVNEFFLQSKKKLLRSGVKTQNIPRDYAKAMLLVSDFNDAAKEVLFEWISDNAGEYDDIGDFDSAIEKLELSKKTGEVLSREEQKDLFRPILFGLVLVKGNESEIAKHLPRLESILAQSIKPQDTTIISNEGRLLDIFCQIALGENIEDGQLDGKLIQYARGIEAIRHSELDKLDKVIALFKNDAVHYPSLKRSRDKLEAILQETSTVSKGLIFNVNSTSNVNIEVEDQEWIGRCRHSKPPTSFVEIFGYVNGREAVSVSEDDLCELLPDVGSIIVFSNRPGGTPQPSIDEVGCWKGELFDTEKPVKFRATIQSRKIFEVVDIPFGSKEPDNIRNWLQQNNAILVNKPVFLLNDNVIIKPTKDVLELKRINFKEPFKLWYSLPAFKAWGKKFILELPSPDGTYDCGEIGDILKKALKLAGEQEKLPKMSAAQIQSFAQFLNDDSKQFEKWQTERILKILQTGLDISCDISGIVEALMDLSPVKAELDIQKNKILDEYQQSQLRAKNEIKDLDRQKEEIKKEIVTAQREAKLLTASLTQSIAKTFESAKENGVSVLAEMALFKALMGQSSNTVIPLQLSQTVPSNNSSPPRSHYAVCPIERLSVSFEDVLRVCGLDRTKARIWNLLINLSVKHDLVVSFRGFASGHIAQAFISTYVKEMILRMEAPVETFSVADWEKALEPYNNWGAIIINSINRMPFDSLALHLEELTLKKWMTKPLSQKAIFTTINESDTCFPITERFRFLGPVFDINQPMQDSAIMPDLYEALCDAKRSTKASLPKIWIEKLIQIFDDAKSQNPEDEKAITTILQHLFISPSALEKIKAH